MKELGSKRPEIFAKNSLIFLLYLILISVLAVPNGEAQDSNTDCIGNLDKDRQGTVYPHNTVGYSDADAEYYKCRYGEWELVFEPCIGNLAHDPQGTVYAHGSVGISIAEPETQYQCDDGSWLVHPEGTHSEALYRVELYSSDLSITPDEDEDNVTHESVRDIDNEQSFWDVFLQFISEHLDTDIETGQAAIFIVIFLFPIFLNLSLYSGNSISVEFIASQVFIALVEESIFRAILPAFIIAIMIFLSGHNAEFTPPEFVVISAIVASILFGLGHEKKLIPTIAGLFLFASMIMSSHIITPIILHTMWNSSIGLPRSITK